MAEDKWYFDTEEIGSAVHLAISSSSELYNDTENSLETLSTACLNSNIIIRMKVVDYMNGKELYSGKNREDEDSTVM